MVHGRGTWLEHSLETLESDPRPAGCKKLVGADHTYDHAVDPKRHGPFSKEMQVPMGGAPGWGIFTGRR